jgi:YD repeat-containing protein
MRLSALAICLLVAACTPSETRAQPATDEELRLIAYLARDPFVVVERTERDADGRLLVITSQGRTRQRYLIAPDDPAKPTLRLRRLEDASSLVTAPNDRLGGGPIPR